MKSPKSKMVEERASDDFFMEMAVDPDSFIDGFSKVETESPDLNETDDEEEKIVREKEEDDDGNTCRFNRMVFHISEKVSEESLKSVWKTKVEPLFKSHSLSCELNWPEHKMILATKTPFVCDENVNKGACALALLFYPGLPSEWLEQIFSDEVHCECIRLTLPDDMCDFIEVQVQDDGFSEKYAMFREKVAKSGLLQKLSCKILYAGKAIFVYSSDPRSPDKMGELVYSCLLNNGPLKPHIELLLLDDEDDDDGSFALEKFGGTDIYKDPEAASKYWKKKYYQEVIAYKENKAETDRSVAACERLQAELDRTVAVYKKLKARKAAAAAYQTWRRSWERRSARRWSWERRRERRRARRWRSYEASAKVTYYCFKKAHNLLKIGYEKRAIPIKALEGPWRPWNS